MKPLYVILIAVTSAVIGGSVVGLIATSNMTETTTSDSLDQNYDADLLLTRLDEAEDKIAELSGTAARRREQEQLATSLEERMISKTALDELESRLSARLDQLTERQLAAMSVRVPGADGEGVVPLDDYIQRRIKQESAKSESARYLRQFRMGKPFIKQGMMRQIRGYRKKLKLTDEQSERLEEASTKAFDTAFPHIETILDPTKSSEEKEVAVAEIESTTEEVNNDAGSYLDSGQYQEFLQLQEENQAGFQTFLQSQLQQQQTGQTDGSGQAPTSATPSGSGN